MDSCDSHLPGIVDLSSGDDGPSARAARLHVDACASCRQALQELAEGDRLLETTRTEPHALSRSAFVSRVMDRVETPVVRRSWWWRRLSLAAVPVAALAAAALALRPAADPPVATVSLEPVPEGQPMTVAAGLAVQQQLLDPDEHEELLVLEALADDGLDGFDSGFHGLTHDEWHRLESALTRGPT